MSILEISSDFESGNIIHKSSRCDKHLNSIINLEIREEPYPKRTRRKYKNWFYFKATNLKGKTKFNIANIRNYFNDWKGYTVCYSYNNKTWKRLKTRVNIEKKRLTWEINPKKSTMWFAFYPPYPFSKSKKLLPNMKTIGYTKEKRPILMKKIGSGPKRVWLISGQHSGETINSWILEGFVKRLLERKSTLSKNLVSGQNLICVPVFLLPTMPTLFNEVLGLPSTKLIKNFLPLRLTLTSNF